MNATTSPATLAYLVLTALDVRHWSPETSPTVQVLRLDDHGRRLALPALARLDNLPGQER